MRHTFSFLLFALILITIQGANASIAVVGSLSRQSKLQPGGTFEGVIFLKNTSATAGEARVYQTDYIFQADGSNEYAEPGSHPRSNAQWISVSPARVKLGPGETAPVRYKGKAPTSPQLRGTYWSMIMIEPNAAPAVNDEVGKDQVRLGLQAKVRMGVQIVTEVGQAAKSELQIQNKALLKGEGMRSFQVDLGNSGERMLVPAVTLEIFGSDGATLGRFDGGRMRIFPTCSARAKVDLSDLPPGKYSAMLMLDAGGDQVMGAQYELQIDP